jgi:uncharacterized iron-regulated protein
MNTIRRWSAWLLWGLVLPVFARADDPQDPRTSSVWIDVYTGVPLPYEAVLQDLAAADVIYLGERHTVERHHAIQAAILTDLAHQAIPLALGLEQIESWQQPSLDRYNRGEIDWKQLAEATDWTRRWSNYRQYEPVLAAARQARAPVVALNARAETIRQVARSGGIAHVPPTARQELPGAMLLPDPVYEKLLSLQLMVHASAAPERLRPMIEAQIARDEAMAQTLATFAKSESGKNRKLLVLCGAGHVAHGQGIPTRVQRRLPGIRDRIVLLSESGEVQLSPEELAQARPIEITHEQLREIKQPVADYLCVKPLARKPRLPSPNSGRK